MPHQNHIFIYNDMVQSHFEKMWGEVNENIQEQDAEQYIIDISRFLSVLQNKVEKWHGKGVFSY